MRLLVVGLCLVAITWTSSARAKDLADGKVAGELWEGNDLQMKFRWCPAGTFMMGSPASEPHRMPGEGPVTVELTRGFWMSQYEVTQGEWQSFMVTTITDQKTKAGASNLYGEGARYPMYYVNHNEATEFCRELTDSERSAGRLPAGWEYRLPTEAQWEYACRAGTTTATAFGSSLSSTQANFNGEYPYNAAAKGPNLEKTAVVGSYKANVWGLCDMHGNVWEWCADWYDVGYYAKSSSDDPTGPVGRSNHVFRGGGAWAGLAADFRSACRGALAPGNSTGFLGFRVVRVPAEK